MNRAKTEQQAMSKNTNHLRIMQRAFNHPLMLEPQYASFAISYLASREGFARVVTSNEVIENPQEHAESYQVRERRVQTLESGERAYMPYAMFGDVAVIGVDGSLIHKNGSMDAYSGMQGYDGIRAKLDRANKDPKVKAILLDYDSPGGEVAGAFALANTIKNNAKPIWSYANELMASAAYLTGSQAQNIYAPAEANIGSIGVVVAHADVSKALADRGQTVTLLHSGAHKVDGNPYGPLPKEVADKIQMSLDKTREKFAALVGVGRGDRFGKDKALATEAEVYDAEEALQIGMIDGIASFDEVLDRLNAAVSTKVSAFISQQSSQGKTMTTEANADMVAVAEAQASAQQAAATAEAKGIKDGADQERARIAAIIKSPEASGREALANTLAFDMAVSADDAQKILSAAPKASAQINQTSAAAQTDELLKSFASAAAQTKEGGDEKQVVASLRKGFAQAAGRPLKEIK
jgi:capsid assembly protease